VEKWVFGTRLGFLELKQKLNPPNTYVQSSNLPKVVV